MRIFTLLFLLLVLAGSSKAQINKGQFLAGGNISFESIKNESSTGVNYETTNIFVSPNIGYFILPKLAGGLRVDLRSYRQKAPYYGNNQTNTSLSPFVRYYFLPSKKMVNIFLDLSYINYRSKFSSSSSPASIEKSHGYYFSGGPCIFLSGHVSLEFILGYKHTKTKDVYDSRSNIFNSGLGLQIHLGKLKPGKRNKNSR